MNIVKIKYLGKPHYGVLSEGKITVFNENLLWEKPDHKITVLRSDTAEYEPPLKPNLIFGVGMNFFRNYSSGQSLANRPVFFLKSPSSIIAHQKSINLSNGASRCWGEPEGSS